MKKITMNDGVDFTVDDEDYETVNQYNWTNIHNRPEARINKKTVWVYRWLLNAPSGVEVDHIDGNALNNTRTNLRLCTRKQNSYNRAFTSGKTHSKYKGVTWHITNRRWQASIRVDGKLKHLGVFKVEEDAAIAYDNAASTYFADFAYLNFGNRGLIHTINTPVTL